MQKSIFSLYLLAITTFTTQAQSATDKQWFWNVNLGTRVESAGGFTSSDFYRSNVFGQFSLGKEKQLSEQWSFLHSYRLLFGYNHYDIDFENFRFPVDGQVIDTRWNSEYFFWRARAEVPVYWRYQLGEKVALTAGVYGAIDFFTYVVGESSIVSIDSANSFNETDNFSFTNWLDMGELGTELGILFRLNERVDLRFNVQQGILTIDNPEYSESGESYFQSASLRPFISGGVNVKFEKE
ncbi:MAG: hypothetical protein AAGI23_00970 [Bacteroidota bacterium]